MKVDGVWYEEEVGGEGADASFEAEHDLFLGGILGIYVTGTLIIHNPPWKLVIFQGTDSLLTSVFFSIPQLTYRLNPSESCTVWIDY